MVHSLYSIKRIKGSSRSLKDRRSHTSPSFETIGARNSLPARKKAPCRAEEYVSLLDQSDKESLKCARYILFSAGGSAVRQAMSAGGISTSSPSDVPLTRDSGSPPSYVESPKSRSDPVRGCSKSLDESGLPPLPVRKQPCELFAEEKLLSQRRKK